MSHPKVTDTPTSGKLLGRKQLREYLGVSPARADAWTAANQHHFTELNPNGVRRNLVISRLVVDRILAGDFDAPQVKRDAPARVTPRRRKAQTQYV